MAYDDVTPAEASQINTMNVASQRAGLGTVIDEMQAIGISNSGSIVANAADILTLEGLAVISGSYTATLADADGSAIEILTGTTGIAGYIVQVYQTGSTMTAHVENSAGGSNLTITPTTTGSWSAIDAGDVVSWIVF